MILKLILQIDSSRGNFDMVYNSSFYVCGSAYHSYQSQGYLLSFCRTVVPDDVATEKMYLDVLH